MRAAMPLPLCHINLAKNFSGGERQTELLIKALADEGWSQRLVVRRGNPLAVRCSEITGLDVREVASNPVAAALAARGATLVHAHDARAVYSGWLLKLLTNTPYLLTRRVVNPQHASWARNSAYNRAAATVAVSDSAADEMRKQQSGVSPTVIVDAHAEFSVRAEQVAEIRRRFGNKTLIGHVGQLNDAVKGQRTLFEVARRMRDTDCAFLFLGAGRDDEAFREECRDLDNVHFTGFVDNVGDYLHAFDLFVFPSVKEAVGSTLLDAMHAGLPIVATRTGGIPEIIRDGRNGILIEPRDVDGCAEAISLLLDDDALRARMAKANEADARQYSAAAMAKSYVTIYRSIVDNL
jgi:glycosyltransferase involved in cell wall biosynthesis